MDDQFERRPGSGPDSLEIDLENLMDDQFEPMGAQPVGFQWSDLPVLQQLAVSLEEAEKLRVACALSAEAAGRPFETLLCKKGF